MRPEPGQVLHFSEDPTIRRFVPRVAATARQPQLYVWAVDAARCPDYWFPRQCSRAMASTTDADRERIIGTGSGDRVHAIEYRWLDALRTVALFAYRLPMAGFRPFGEPTPNAYVATEPVEPLGPAPRASAEYALATPSHALRTRRGARGERPRPGMRAQLELIEEIALSLG